MNLNMDRIVAIGAVLVALGGGGKTLVSLDEITSNTNNSAQEIKNLRSELIDEIKKMNWKLENISQVSIDHERRIMTLEHRTQAKKPGD